MPKLIKNRSCGDAKAIVFEHLNELLLSKNNGTHTELCKELGVSRTYVYQVLKSIGLVKENKKRTKKELKKVRKCKQSK